MDKFEEFYKQHCLDHFGYDPDLNLIFEKHEDGSYIQIEVENAKKVFKHQQAKVEEANAKAQMCRDEKNHAINRWSAVCKERDELQKRVDKALQALKNKIEKVQRYEQDSFDHGAVIGLDSALRTVEQALKGEG
ncbi:hypothetical protein WBV14_04165 [Acinetobacter baumannii]